MIRADLPEDLRHHDRGGLMHALSIDPIPRRTPVKTPPWWPKHLSIDPFSDTEAWLTAVAEHEASR